MGWDYTSGTVSKPALECQQIHTVIHLRRYYTSYPRGGTDLERGYGDVRPWRPPFHASPVVRKGPISRKRVSSQDPLLRKFENFSHYSLKFCLNFSLQAPKGNFQLTSPQIWKFLVHKPQIWAFSVHKPPLSETNISSQAPHFGNPGRTPLPEKKLSAPPSSYPKISMFCVVSQSYQHLFEKWYSYSKFFKELKNRIKI